MRLERRAVGPVRETIDSIAPTSRGAHRHLTAALEKLVGRDPDRLAGYTDIIRSVEAAASR